MRSVAKATPQESLSGTAAAPHARRLTRRAAALQLLSAVTTSALQDRHRPALPACGDAAGPTTSRSTRPVTQRNH